MPSYFIAVDLVLLNNLLIKFHVGDYLMGLVPKLLVHLLLFPSTRHLKLGNSGNGISNSQNGSRFYRLSC